MKKISILLVLLVTISTFGICASAEETPLGKLLSYYRTNNTVSSFEEASALAYMGYKIGDEYLLSNDTSATGLGEDDSVATLAKTILFAKACGKNIKDFAGRDAVSLLTASQNADTGCFGNGIYDTFIAMLALDAAGGEYDASAAAEYLLSNRNESGAFGYVNYTEPYDFVPDPDTTAMMILPLSNHKDISGITDAISKACEYLLSAIDTTTGGYIASWSGKENPSTAACALTAFVSAGTDLSDSRIDRLKTSLLSFQNSDGSFTKDITEPGTYDAFSTSQALLALTSLENGETPYGLLSRNHSYNFKEQSEYTIISKSTDTQIKQNPTKLTDSTAIADDDDSPSTADITLHTLPMLFLSLIALVVLIKKRWQA